MFDPDSPSNEDLLREGECPEPNCVEPVGHGHVTCTKYSNTTQSTCLRPVVQHECPVCGGHGEQVVGRGERYGGKCHCCGGTGRADRCEDHRLKGVNE